MANRKGFTLTEIILAMAVFAIVVVMLMGTFVSGFAGISLAGQRAKVLREVQTVAEDLASRSYANAGAITTYAGGHIASGFVISIAAEETRAGVVGFPVTVSRSFLGGRQTLRIQVFAFKGGV